MPEPAERFIEAAVAPLADNPELEIAARRELAEAIAAAGAKGGDSLDRAAARLEETSTRPRVKWVKYTLYAVLAVVSLGILGMSAKSFYLYRLAAQEIGMIGGIGAASDPDAWRERFGRGLTAEQKLLLLGDTRRRGKADRFKGLWDSDPGNPAYFADYAAAHLSEHTSLPPDFLETARGLDPDNAWFPIIAAAEAARASIETYRSTPLLSPGGLKLKTIKDPAKLEEALALLHEAAPLKRFDNYQMAVLRQRIPLLPKRTDSVDQFVPITYVAGLTAPNLRFRNLSDAATAKAIQMAKDKDVEGFKRLVADWQAFTDTYVRCDHGTMVDVLVALVVIRGPLKAFHEAATDLGLPEEAARAKELDDRFEAWKSATKAAPNPNDRIAMRSSVLAGLSIPIVSKQSSRSPVVTAEELEPGRRADHALAGRVLSLATWLILGIALLAAALFRFRGSGLTRRLSERLGDLLRPVDWLAILGGGLLLPLLGHWIVTRLTPLGGLEWSLKASAFLLPAGQYSALLWLMIVLPVMIARQRLAARGGVAGLGSGKQIFGWLAVLSGMAALPLFGVAMLGEKPEQNMLIAAGGLLGLLQLYALVIAFRALFSRQSGLLRRATISRVLVPVYAAGMAAMMVAVPLYHAEEKHWVARDRLMEVSVDEPSMGRFEYRVTRVMKQELLEIVTARR